MSKDSKQLSMFDDVVSSKDAMPNDSAMPNHDVVSKDKAGDDTLIKHNTLANSNALTDFETNTLTEIQPQPENDYEPLDYQLAQLMLEQNTFHFNDDNNANSAQRTEQQAALHRAIKQYTLAISRHTREGQIALPIAAVDAELLLHSNVAGQAGEYTPLVIDKGYVYLHRYWQYQHGLVQSIRQRIAMDNGQVETGAEGDAETNTNTATTTTITTKITSRVAAYFSQDNTKQTDTNWQQRAAELALQQSFLIVSGGPGTGKTTTITRMLALLIEQALFVRQNTSENHSEQNAIDLKADGKNLKKWGGVPYRIVLAAPTGKAAIRMLDSMREAIAALQTQLDIEATVLECLPDNATTLHRLLGSGYQSSQVKYHKNNPLHADVVLVDEASMVDIALMQKLFDAVPERAKLILVGDKNQLASVETGSVFADICDGLAESPYVVTLTKNWRFAADSDIGQCATAANAGDSETLLQIFNDPHRVDAKRVYSPEFAPTASTSTDILDDARLIEPWQNYFELLGNDLNDSDASIEQVFAAFNQYRVLCALRRGLLGSEGLNTRIEHALSKKGWIKSRQYRQANRTVNASAAQNATLSSSWYHGKPIMITQNSFSKGLVNGDTGLALVKNGELSVYFPSITGEYQSFSPVRLPPYESNWAMTIHKSQGSEFDHVLLMLPQEPMPLLTKQLLYTGITRAKKSVSLYATDEVIRTAIRAKNKASTQLHNCLERE